MSTPTVTSITTAPSTSAPTRVVTRIVDARLWALAVEHPRLLALTVALQVAVTLTYWAQAAFLAVALAALARTAVDGSPLPAWPFVGVIGVLLARLVLSLIHTRTAVRLGETVRATLRSRLLRALLVPARLHDADERLGARRLALTDGVDGIDAYTSRYIAAALQVWILCPLVVIAVGIVQPWAALGLGLCIGVAVIGPRLWKRALLTRGTAHWDSYEQLSADHLESLRAMPTLRVLGAVDRRRAVLAERSDALHRHTVATMRLSLMDTALIDLGIQAGMALTATLAAIDATTGRITPTSTYLLLMLSSEAFRPVRDLARHWHAGYLGLTALDSIDAALGQDAPPSPGRAAAPATVTPGTSSSEPRLDLRGVEFAYRPGTPVVDGIDLTLTPGGLTALTGPSGSGKSTLFDLVLGLLTPDAGRIDHTGRMAVVSQHSYLFPGTVADILRTAAPHADDAALRAALDAVGLTAEVRSWPHGLQTRLGESGSGTSGGQRQRLAIARTLLADADIVLLDEPTSALDDTSARIVTDTLRAQARERVVLMIAHRPEALAAADTVLRIEAGRIRPTTDATEEPR